MGTASKKPINQDFLLAAVKKHVEAAGGHKGRISMKQFLASAGLMEHDIFKFYPSWNDTLRAAGVKFDPWTTLIDTERLLADWGTVARKFKCIPNCKLYGIHGKYGQCTLSKRFGKWSNVAAAFWKFAAGKKEWADVRALFEVPERPCGHTKPKQDLVSFGQPLPIESLRNAPANENGVIYLFGVLAARLGFSVEAVRPAFPDCIAKRRVAPGEWQNVRIEFEYESRNFRDHRHPPEGCDLIVCWSHNWPDCPKTLEVIALDEELKKL